MISLRPKPATYAAFCHLVPQSTLPLNVLVDHSWRKRLLWLRSRNRTIDVVVSYSRPLTVSTPTSTSPSSAIFSVSMLKEPSRRPL